MFEVHDSIKDLAGATPARKLLVTRALEYLDSLSQEAGSDTSLRRELAAAYERVGDVQGNPFSANLGDTAGALASYRKALTIRESLPTDNSEESQRNLANDYEWIGMALETLGDYSGALNYYRKDFAIREILARTAPLAKSQERLAGAYFLIGHCYAALRDANSALESYQKSAAIRENIVAESPLVQTRLAGTYGFIAGLVDVRGSHDEALALQQKAFTLVKQLADSDGNNATYREFLEESYYWTGFYLERKKSYSQALINYQRALTGFQALSSADPKEARTKRYVAKCEMSIGTTLVAKGNILQGLQHIRKATLIFEELPAPENTEYIADSYGALGFAYARMAAKPGISAALQATSWRQSREAYQKSLDNWLEVKNRGALNLFTDSEPDRIKNELASCDAALSRHSLQNH